MVDAADGAAMRRAPVRGLRHAAVLVVVTAIARTRQLVVDAGMGDELMEHGKRGRRAGASE